MVTIVGFLTADGHYAYALWIDSAASFSVDSEVRVRIDWAWSWRPPVAVDVVDTEPTRVDGAEPADPAESQPTGGCPDRVTCGCRPRWCSRSTSRRLCSGVGPS